MSKTTNYSPKYKPGDLVSYTFESANVVYQVHSLSDSRFSDPNYFLTAIKILSLAPGQDIHSVKPHIAMDCWVLDNSGLVEKFKPSKHKRESVNY